MAKPRTTLLPSIGFIWDDGSEVLAHEKGQGGRIMLRIKCGGCAVQRSVRYDPKAVGGRCIHCHADSRSALVIAWAARQDKLKERLARQAETNLKRCAECKEEKPLEAFHVRTRAHDGLSDYCMPCMQKKKREQNYGLTDEEFEKMVEAQRGVCAIETCKEPLNHVDHCHDTGVVRGLLCATHNLMIHQGMKSDTYLAIAAYLQKTENKTDPPER